MQGPIKSIIRGAVSGIAIYFVSISTLGYALYGVYLFGYLALTGALPFKHSK